jgi:arylsulfatase
VAAGDHQVRLEFTYDGGGLGKGATADIYLDGNHVATGRVDATQPLAFSGDETLDVGADTATPVSDDYTSRESQFTGRIHRVQIDLGADAEDNDHLITAEERMRLVTTRQ